MKVLQPQPGSCIGNRRVLCLGLLSNRKEIILLYHVSLPYWIWGDGLLKQRPVGESSGDRSGQGLVVKYFSIVNPECFIQDCFCLCVFRICLHKWSIFKRMLRWFTGSSLNSCVFELSFLETDLYGLSPVANVCHFYCHLQVKTSVRILT